MNNTLLISVYGKLKLRILFSFETTDKVILIWSNIECSRLYEYQNRVIFNLKHQTEKSAIERTVRWSRVDTLHSVSDERILFFVSQYEFYL